MVADAKNMVLAMDDPNQRERWRASSRDLVEAVAHVGQMVSPTYLHPTAAGHLGHAPPPASPNQRGANGFGRVKAGDIPIAEMRQLSVQGECWEADEKKTVLGETDSRRSL